MSNFMRTKHIAQKTRPSYFQARDLLLDKPWRKTQEEWAATERKNTMANYCLVAALAIIVAALVAGGMK